MRNLAVVLGVAVALSGPARAAEQDRSARETLDDARVLAGGSGAGLPIVLTSVLPNGASPGVEGWTIHRADGSGEQIFVYAGSAVFRCASTGNNRQCLLRLASIIVHEAWHFKHGGNENDAYAAQIAFLMGNHAAPDQITGVRRSRASALAAERSAIAAAKALRSEAR